MRIVRKAASGKEVDLGSLQAGELFGEYALLPTHQSTQGGGAKLAHSLPGAERAEGVATQRIRQRSLVHSDLELDAFLRLHAGTEGVLDQRHLRDQVGGIDQLLLGAAASDDNM